MFLYNGVMQPLIDRLLSKMSPVPECGCWIWLGSLNNKGYGQISLGGRRRGCGLAHRVSYTLLVGDIPEGLTIDHLCRVKSCINPAHMETVPGRENHRRGLPQMIAAAQKRVASKTHCKRGHKYTLETTGLQPSGRFCKLCRSIRSKERAKI